MAPLAFEFLVLTAARWGDVRWAELSEIDQPQGMWTVPETRTKSKREHRVPLCHQAQEILDEARILNDGAARLVFTRGAEAALAHKVRNPVEAAYRRTDRFERRPDCSVDPPWSSSRQAS